LSGELLRRHPNLHMSLRFPAGFVAKGFGMPPAAHLAFDPQGRPSVRWLELVGEFPDRFVLGGDYFVVSPLVQGQGPAVQFAKLSAWQRELAGRFLSALPAETARKVGIENAVRLYLSRR
jgi:hypothetical protein